jgi:hypothetical protein
VEKKGITRNIVDPKVLREGKGFDDAPSTEEKTSDR